jgi:hypothetical protein
MLPLTLIHSVLSPVFAAWALSVNANTNIKQSGKKPINCQVSGENIDFIIGLTSLNLRILNKQS